MNEYFIIANSFAAPFFSDTSYSYFSGDTPQDALEKFVLNYKRPCGLYAANLYRSADDYHKNKPYLVRWISNAAKYGENTKDPKCGNIECPNNQSKQSVEPVGKTE